MYIAYRNIYIGIPTFKNTITNYYYAIICVYWLGKFFNLSSVSETF